MGENDLNWNWRCLSYVSSVGVSYRTKYRDIMDLYGDMWYFKDVYLSLIHI